MIRIRNIPFKIFLLLLFVGIPTEVFPQISMGARGAALGHATTAIDSYDWALFSNPAMLNSESPRLGFYGIRNYGFSEITDISAFGSVPTKFGTGALGIHRYGGDLFNETRIRFGYKNVWQNLHFGFALNYNHIAFGGPYGSGGALGVDLGIAAEITSELWLGAKATNVNRPSYDFQSYEEDLIRDLSIGMSYMLAERALFTFDVYKDVKFPVSYRGGVEVTVIENLVARVGITTEPVTYSFGFGYGRGFWQVDLVVQKDQNLGLSPGLDLIISL